MKLCKWIFCLVQHSSRLVKADLLYIYTDVLKYLIQALSKVTESNSSVMWEALFDQHMTVETSHLWNCKDADGTKGPGCHWQYLALCYISAQNVVSCTL